MSINDFVHIRGGGGVRIEDGCLIAPHVVITSQSHDVDAVARGLDYRNTNTALPIHIGRNVWIGAGAVVLPGVTIGDGAIVAAGAVVSRDVDARCLVAGIPARFVRAL
ncbi:DapH/DapD/GlmU-related protein [Phenylobacterium sp.]|uniref:acyltransferase n=1 Tax=Phenylobacterium sp. TaxID=1871053 RepID=UPI003521FA6E